MCGILQVWGTDSFDGRLRNDRDDDIRIRRIGQIWKSEVNGWVYDMRGLAPSLTVGQHSGVSPKILVYDED